MSFIINYVQDTAMGYLTTGLTAAGGVAGNAVGGVGSMVENGGRSIGDCNSAHTCSSLFLAFTNILIAVEGFFKKGGDFVNGYGDRLVNATATQDGPIKKQPIKALDKKPAPSSAPKQANGYTKNALPAASSKVKGLPAPPASAAKVASTPKALPKTPATPYIDPYKSVNAAKDVGGKVKVSAASKPKPAVGALGSAASKSTSALPKPPPGPGLPKVNNITSAKNDAGKVRVSAASKPKPVVK